MGTSASTISRTRSDCPQTTTQQKIEELQHLTRDELLQRWLKHYKTPPMKGARTTTLIRGIAFRMQERAGSTLKPSVSKQLVKIARGGPIDPQSVLTRPKLQAGTKLVREWNGRTYEVTVLNDGFQMNGTDYPSLSAIAKVITGAHWSGPRFFGLKS